MTSSATFTIAATNLEMYVNFEHNFVCVTPEGSKRDGIIFDLDGLRANLEAMKCDVALEIETTVYTTDHFEAELKELAFDLVVGNHELNKTTVTEQMSTIKTLNDNLRAGYSLIRKF